MPADAPRRPEEGPRSAADAPAQATLPAKAREALGGAISKPEGPPRRRPGACGAAPETAPERLRNVGVAKIPELKM